MPVWRKIQVKIASSSQLGMPTLCKKRKGWATRRCALASLLFSATMSLGQTTPPSILCNAGDGRFDGEFSTGIKVHVGAARQHGSVAFATRACEAVFRWGNQELTVATDVSQLDLETFGADLGDGMPVAAFQEKKTDADCCMDYMIYSLERPPRLLRTITGGQFFSASDKDLDGRVEVWTRDAAAVNGFENFGLSEIEYPPAVAFRIEHSRLLDVSAEFQPYFDDEITEIRTGLQAQDLQNFRRSDGKLEATLSISPARLYHLRIAKIKVLEIVWAYLYSGREQRAWQSLAEMWPPEDVDRIRAAITKARARGLHSQADGASPAPAGKKKHTMIFDAVRPTGPENKLEVLPPQPILMQRPASSAIPQGSDAEKRLDLVVDEVGKVRSAEPAGNVKWVDPELINAALTWKFIPAFKDGRPVASRIRLDVSLMQ